MFITLERARYKKQGSPDFEFLPRIVLLTGIRTRVFKFAVLEEIIYSTS